MVDGEGEVESDGAVDGEVEDDGAVDGELEEDGVVDGDGEGDDLGDDEVAWNVTDALGYDTKHALVWLGSGENLVLNIPSPHSMSFGSPSHNRHAPCTMLCPIWLPFGGAICP